MVEFLQDHLHHLGAAVECCSHAGVRCVRGRFRGRRRDHERRARVGDADDDVEIGEARQATTVAVQAGRDIERGQDRRGAPVTTL